MAGLEVVGWMEAARVAVMAAVVKVVGLVVAMGEAARAAETVVAAQEAAAKVAVV